MLLLFVAASLEVFRVCLVFFRIILIYHAVWYEMMGIDNVGSSANVVDWYAVQAI